jgi:hypothetical protein
MVESLLEGTEFNGIYNDKQTEIHTAEALVPESSAFEFEIDVEKLQRHESPGTGQIPTELFTAGGRKFHNVIHKLINSIWNNAELPEERKELIIVYIYKKSDKNRL